MDGVATAAPLAEPPYGLSFGGARGRGCAVVWLELPFSYARSPF